MKSVIVAVLLVISAGCGGDEEDAPSLVGDWAAEAGGGCAYGVSFEDDGTYTEGVVCELEGGGLGVEVYGGTYTTSGDDLTTKQTRGSCADAEPLTERLVYELDGDSLRIGSAAGTLVFQRAEGGDGVTGQATFGCYAADGSFTPMPIAEL